MRRPAKLLFDYCSFVCGGSWAVGVASRLTALTSSRGCEIDGAAESAVETKTTCRFEVASTPAGTTTHAASTMQAWLRAAMMEAPVHVSLFTPGGGWLGRVGKLGSGPMSSWGGGVASRWSGEVF